MCSLLNPFSLVLMLRLSDKAIVRVLGSRRMSLVLLTFVYMISNADPGASVDTINRVDAGPENPTVAANKNEAAGSAHAGIPAINATIRRQVPDVGQVRSVSVTSLNNELDTLESS
ncbi:hypothetical protein PSHT_03391 [Puccinia striiformis]|uniref:Uncharacterized protein n=1 Tax=Puccinia striiformis TaxID=27350 RepID=A0A2S4WFD1_9BASI|nr:hypothetical protein PSHT_03391 [Puccinia striiformis]